MRGVKGSITVFMSLCLTACLLFAGTILESARIMLIRSQISRGAEAAMDSLFADYDGDLFDEFGILMFNTADTQYFGELNNRMEEGIRVQMCLNPDRFLIGGNLFRAVDVKVQDIRCYSAVSKDGELFARSVLDYMKYRVPVSLVTETLEKLNLLEEGESAREDTKEAEKQETLLLEEEEIDDEVYEKYEELADESMIGEIEKLKEKGYMELLLPSDEVVSDKSTTKGGFPSNYYSGSPMKSGNLLADMANNLLYCEYLLEHFVGFTEKSGNPVLNYELEYILYGSASDRKNLEFCINRLLLIREGLNIITIYRDQALKVQADGMAAALAGWTGLAPAVEIAKLAVIGAWAYAEAIVDVRTLLSGNPVPLMKAPGQWSLELEAVPELAKGIYLNTGQYDSGAFYPEYLRLLLLLTDEHLKYYRTMDMIQCRMMTRKPGFYLNECVYAMEAEIIVEARPLFLNLFGQRNPGSGEYRFKTGVSRMY